MVSSLDVDEIKEYLQTVPENSKIYLGCDSDRYKINEVWMADYAIVLVVHKGGNRGCKIFGEVQTERDYDTKKDRPSLRLMNEVYKVSQFYLDNYDELFANYETDIHLDINPNEEHGSSCVITQAVGYIKGVCGFAPKTKPEAFSASYAADRFKSIQHHTARYRELEKCI